MSPIENKIITRLKEFGITNKLEIAYFLAQANHESANFTKFSEGEKYRFGRAKDIWRNRFKLITTKQVELGATNTDFCPQPWLFDLVYGARMGNQLNGTNDHDGYNFRGAGIFQLTGKANYLSLLNWLQRQGKCLTMNIDNIRDYVMTEDGAIVSAIWYWAANGIGVAARADNITKVSIAINGGTIGLEERKKLTERYKKELKC